MNDTTVETLETIMPTPEEMEKRIARFKDLNPTKCNTFGSVCAAAPASLLPLKDAL